MDSEKDIDSTSDGYGEFKLLYSDEYDELCNTVLPPVFSSSAKLETLTGSDFLTKRESKYTIEFYQRGVNPHIFYVEAKYGCYNYLVVLFSSDTSEKVVYNGVVASRSKALHIIWYYRRIAKE